MSFQMFGGGWSRRFLADGVELVAPEGPRAARVRVLPVVSPLRPLRAIVEEKRAAMPGPVEGGAIERLVTVEGEYGATVTLRGPGATRVLGFVIGDTSYAEIDGMASDDARAAELARWIPATTELTTLGLGEGRRRRFWHAIPEGWRALPRAEASLLVPDDFPRVRALIRVGRARPANTGPEHVLYRQLFEDPPVPAIGDARTFQNPRGLSVRLEESGPSLEFRWCRAQLNDDRYVYPVSVEADDDAWEDALVQLSRVVASVEPLPRRRAAPAASTTSSEPR